MPLPHERLPHEREPFPPRPPHEREPLPPRPPEGITHEDLVDLIETKFERVFNDLEEIKERLR
jgi:hypothetical protein